MLLATDGVAYLALILLLLRVFFKKLQVLNARFLVFVLTCAALGPGIIVNGLLKRFSGRVRPRNRMFLALKAPFHRSSTSLERVDQIAASSQPKQVPLLQ